MLVDLVEKLFIAVDTSDWDAMLKIYHPDIIYERPGYSAFRGIDSVMHFYKHERVLASGEHHLEHVVCDDNEGACWGRFVGLKKDGSKVDERFADVQTFEDGQIKTRRSYFFRPAV